jgi:hypothetical protein
MVDRDALLEEVREMPAAARDAFLSEAGGHSPLVDDLHPRTRGALWIIVVCAFAVVLVGAFVVLAVGVFVKDIRPELVLTMFTSVVGFLAGLFAPSPVSASK